MFMLKDGDIDSIPKRTFKMRAAVLFGRNMVHTDTGSASRELLDPPGWLQFLLHLRCGHLGGFGRFSEIRDKPDLFS